MKTSVAIVGAGLAGLYAALLLERAGISYVVLEARERIGGRILSVGAAAGSATLGGAPGPYDLGPAWIWPDTQPLIRQLITQMGIRIFPQHVNGAFLAERAASGSVQRYEPGFGSEPPSMRVAGGMRTLVEVIASRLRPAAVRCGQRATAISVDPSGGVLVEISDGGVQRKLTANSVILALPPRLALRAIGFEPALPPQLQAALASIPTWMAAHAKVIALYEAPFWRSQGLSGSASSDIGPLVEIHDASVEDGLAALFGFVGLPAQARLALGEAAVQRLAVAQLARLFGTAAASPLAVKSKDWSADTDTAAPEDHALTRGHAPYGPVPQPGAHWAGRLAFGGTEVAPHDGGYLEGALASASAAIAQVTAPGAGPGGLAR